MSHYAFEAHDHETCVESGVATAEEICTERGLQLTRTRKRVLEILLSEHKAMGAYDILDVLRAEGLGSQPPVAYRALEFLINQGFAHRIERLNAFVACSHLEASHAPVFLICRLCNSVSEVQSDSRKSEISRLAKRAGFAVELMVREAEGICPKCARVA
ncbi:Fur family transcriptional regulator, zinc uptake regulator [Roseivivax halotolerans]|uniref:Fur family transcriptional regulator, zinc uptake regulator n=1 Tax=Roseivivax halotolerans TaxID=93684 RepID=A0A1I5ZXQ8_9RHOB|nr:transcriptional repressor [Roseivivax halotolerans]SFQ61180.1 Fur family transcriptional regulator, zinc uptake regulator [Roseivivax halotolerans]